MNVNDELEKAQSESPGNNEVDVNSLMEDLPDAVLSHEDGKKQEPIKEDIKSRKKRRTLPYKRITFFLVILAMGLGLYLNKDLISLNDQPVSFKLPSFTLTQYEEPEIDKSRIQLTYATKGELLSLASSIREENKRYTRDLVKAAVTPISKRLNDFDNQLAILSQKQLDLDVAFTELLESSPEDFSSFQAAIQNLKNEGIKLNGVMKAMIKDAKETQTLAKTLKENEWGIHTRLKKVEKLFVKNKPSNITNVIPAKATAKNKAFRIKTKAIPTAQKVEWNNKHPWKLKLSSKNFTQILNVQSNQLMRIYDGVEVEGCGLVTNINVKAREVHTQLCKITRSSNY